MYHGSAQCIDAKLENTVCPAFVVVVFVCVCVCVLYTCVDLRVVMLLQIQDST